MTKPDLIYFNGEIHSFDKDNTIYEAVAVRDGAISAVGSNDFILKQKSSETNVIDLHRKTVIPGLIDAHMHIFNLGFNLSYVDCRLSSINKVQQAIKKRAKEINNKDEWIIGWGFDESYYDENRKPNKWDFEDIENPVLIKRYCLHEAVINESGFRRANITSDTFIQNGIIQKNKHGEQTGLLIEKAIDLVENNLPAYSDENMKTAITLATDHLLERGITSVHDAGLGFLIDPFKEFRVLQEMFEEGSLKIRAYVMILAEYYEEFFKEYHNYDNDFLKIGSMKLFADGTLSGKTAAVIEPYKDSGNTGILLHSDDYFDEYITIAQKLNKQVAVHAIGDRAINQILTAYEKSPKIDHRYRIEHTTVSNKNILKRMKKLRAIPIPQPLLIHVAGDMYNIEKEYLDNVFAIKSYIDYDLKPAGSSDAPVVECSPLLGIYAAMTRKTIKGRSIGEEQKINLKNAIRMYTVNAAYAAFEEDIKGSIEIGKFADFTVLPEGFINYNAEEIKQTTVELTIVNGEIAYEKRSNKI